MVKKKQNAAVAFMQKLFAAYGQNKTDQMAAALSTYAIFSLPSLIVLILMIGSFFYGQAEIKTNLSTFLASSLGGETSQSIMGLIDAINASTQKTSVTIFSLIMLIVSATALFEHIIHSMHVIWNVEGREKLSFAAIAWNKVYAFLFILFIDIVFFLSFFLENILDIIKNIFPAASQFEYVFLLLDILMSLLLPFLLFFFIFRVLAQVKVSSKDAALGALVTSLLFVIGNFLLGIYFKNFVDYSAFGAANTVITMLVWIYYVSQILFIGAEITYIWSKTNSVKSRV